MDLTNRNSASSPGLIPIVIAGIGIIVGGFLIGSLTPRLFPPQASAEAQQVDTLFQVLLIIGGAIFLLVQGLLLYSVLRFRARPGDMSDGPAIHGNVTLEFIWTAIPAVIVLFLVIYSYQVWVSIRTVRPDIELAVNAQGQQFAWTFTYTDPLNRLENASAQNFSDGILHTYVGRPVVVQMTTQDVNHAFWVPSMRVKQDLIAGKTTEVRFTPTIAGDYPVVCAELCGGGHAQMFTTIRVHESEEAWMQNFVDLRVDRILNPPDDPVLQGLAAIDPLPCKGCHVLVDDANGLNWNGNQGPALTGIGDTAVRRAASAGLSTAEEYLANSIRHPNNYIVPGFQAGVMPQFGPTEETPAVVDGAYYRYMSDQDLRAVVAFLCMQTGSGTSACTDADADGQPDVDALELAVEAQSE